MKYTLILIFCGTDVMLLERKYEPVKGMLTGVGGHIEENETSEECAHRELFEEANFDTELKYAGNLPGIDSILFIGTITNKPFDHRYMAEGNISWYDTKEVCNDLRLTRTVKAILSLLRRDK